MAEPITTKPTKRIAVVTGANKGIGFEICRQLASNGVMVVLTARDEKRGVEVVEKLKESFSDLVVFHQLDVSDPSSVDSLAAFVKDLFGRLDILVNNAGVLGSEVDWDALKASGATGATDSQVKWEEVLYQSHELSEKCIETNYYGAKRMVEALIPLLQLSDSPRIVNVSSSFGQLKCIPNEWAKGVLRDAENLFEKGIEEVLSKFLGDSKEGKIEINGWPAHFSAYIVSKAALNAYTKLMAKNFPAFRINCICPGYVSIDINNYTGVLIVEEGAASPVRLALLPDDGPSGLFFSRSEESSFECMVDFPVSLDK